MSDPKTWERPFTADTAAEHLGCSSRHIRNLCKTGHLEHFRLGNLLRIPAAAVRELQLRQRQGTEQPPQGDQRRPYTAEAAAEFLGCSPRHIRNLCKAGKLRHFYVGRLLRIPASAIDELMEGNGPTGEPKPEKASPDPFVPPIVLPLRRE